VTRRSLPRKCGSDRIPRDAGKLPVRAPPGRSGLFRKGIVMNSSRLLVLITLCCVGCSSRQVVLERRSPEVVVVQEKSSPGKSGKRLGIPPGHLPPPGQCRVWYAGVPPGRQPPPGSCRRLANELPAGAWLIQRSQDRPGQVRVSECHHSKPSVIVAVRIYEVGSGKLVREETDSSQRVSPGDSGSTRGKKSTKPH
jgi:hypothetical protein